MNTIVTFGEIMARFTTPGHQRIRQALPGPLDVTFGGAEANVAASISLLGGSARYITALPNNDLADACLADMRAAGIDLTYVQRTKEGRLGLYFLENGANQRPSRVTYDRDYSAISMADAGSYAWADAFAGATWFHTTGITPSLSAKSAEATATSLAAAKAQGLTTSVDLNFRGKLWKWDKSKDARTLARATMGAMMHHVDVVIANEEDAADVLDIHAGDTDVHSGKIDPNRYRDVARTIAQRYPNVSLIAITLRESISASHNNWGAMLYDVKNDLAHLAPLTGDEYTPYQIHNIVDRVGGGDSFGAGLIFALTTPELSDPATAIKFAVASSCLAHSIEGDLNYTTRAEVEALLKQGGSGRVVR